MLGCRFFSVLTVMLVDNHGPVGSVLVGWRLGFSSIQHDLIWGGGVVFEFSRLGHWCFVIPTVFRISLLIPSFTG